MNKLIQINDVVFQISNHEILRDPIHNVEFAVRIGEIPFVQKDYFAPILGHTSKRLFDEFKSGFLNAVLLKEDVSGGRNLDHAFYEYVSSKYSKFQEAGFAIGNYDKLEELTVLGIYRYFEAAIRDGKKDYPSFDKFDNYKVRNSLVNVLKRQGPTNLINLHIGQEVGLQFNHIFIGIESDGYAHS
jgi:hypothetical protein